jgi:chitinase
VVSGIKDWMQSVPKTKLVLGLPFVGFEWLLADPDYQHGLFAPANGPASTGIGDDGLIFYRDIITKAGFHQAHDPIYDTVYCYDSRNWIGYDDPEIIKKKIKYAKKNGLLGYFGWHVGADDRDWTLSRTGWHKFYIYIYIYICSNSCIWSSIHRFNF